MERQSRIIYAESITHQIEKEGVEALRKQWEEASGKVVSVTKDNGHLVYEISNTPLKASRESYYELLEIRKNG